MLLGREDVNPNIPDKRGRTPLSRATWKGHDGVAKLLLEREGVDSGIPTKTAQAHLAQLNSGNIICYAPFSPRLRTHVHIPYIVGCFNLPHITFASLPQVHSNPVDTAALPSLPFPRFRIPVLSYCTSVLSVGVRSCSCNEGALSMFSFYFLPSE